MTDTTEPTAEEMAAAQAVFDRKRDAEIAKRAAALPKVKELIKVDGFSAVLAKATRLRASFNVGDAFYDHLNAMVIRMQNLETDIGTTIIAAAPVAVPLPAPAA